MVRVIILQHCLTIHSYNYCLPYMSGTSATQLHTIPSASPLTGYTLSGDGFTRHGDQADTCIKSTRTLDHHSATPAHTAALDAPSPRAGQHGGSTWQGVSDSGKTRPAMPCFTKCRNFIKHEPVGVDNSMCGGIVAGSNR